METNRDRRNTIVAALAVLSKKETPEIPPTILSALDESLSLAPEAQHWDDSGVILELAEQAGIAARLRQMNVDELRLTPSRLFLPAVTALYVGGEWRTVVLEGRKNGRFVGRFLDNNDEGGIWDEAIFQDSSQRVYEAELQHRASRVEKKLLSHGAKFDELQRCRNKFGDEKFILTADYIAVLADDVVGKEHLVTILLQNPDLAATLSHAHHVHTELPQLGLPLIIAEGGLGFLSPITRNENRRHLADDNEHDVEHARLTPAQRAFQLIKLERRDIWIVAAYGMIIGLASLITPLSVNAIISTISAGVFTLPLVVLSLSILFALMFAGAVSIVQMYVVEILQQRLFVNTAFEVSFKVQQARMDSMHGEYAPELLNRFFDIVTIQKAMSKLLIDGLGAVLIGVAGIILVAFISQELLILSIFFLIFSFLLLYFLGRGALTTSIMESKKKYAVAAFLEDVGRSMMSFKLTGTVEFISRKADFLLHQYLKYRRAHFSVLARQLSGFAVLKAIVNTGVLAIGGFLVIEREITLGQLAATEIVIVTLIVALEKLFRQLEVAYDCLTALDKVGHITDLELERSGGTEFPAGETGISVQCHAVAFSYENIPILRSLTLNIPSGARVSLVGKSGAGKSTLAHLLVGVIEPKLGTVLLNDLDTRTINLDSLRRELGLVLPIDEIIEGTVYENIVMGRSWVAPHDVMSAVRLTRLDETFLRLPKGLQTELISNGKNLSTGEIRRLMIARAIVHQPRLLILDEAFTGIEENLKINLIHQLYDKRNPWTVIEITHDPEVVSASETVLVLKDGVIADFGTPVELALQEHNHFCELFPDLSEHFRSIHRLERSGGSSTV